MATPDEILNVMEFLADQYPDSKIGSRLEFWLEALAEYDAQVLLKAAVRHVKTSKFFPKFSELIELVEREQEALMAPQQTTILWAQAQALLGAYFRGEITEQQLEADKAWKWHERQRRPVSDQEQARLDRAWELAQVETEAWMVEEFGANWRQLPADTETSLVVRRAVPA